MDQIGQTTQLTIREISQYGAFLESENLGSILLPKRYLTESMKAGTEVTVFIYLDSEDRLVATTETPKVKVGEFAWLDVLDVTEIGAFLDWGLSKDLLVPFREQKQKMQPGKKYLVYAYLDDATKRIVASAKIEKFLDNISPQYTPGDKVNLIINDMTDLGYKAIVDHTFSGLLYHNETDVVLEKGQKTIGYIKRIREDEKLDLSLTPLGQEAITDNSQKILQKISENNDFLPLTDNSTPEAIKSELGISKKAFKKAIGQLYKQGLIALEKTGIRKI